MTRDEGREISRVSQHLPRCVCVEGGGAKVSPYIYTECEYIMQ